MPNSNLPSSPRYYSDGSYGTGASLYSSCSSSQLGSGSPAKELSSSSEYLARVKIQEYYLALPSKSWLGKHLVDCSHRETYNRDDIVTLAGELWTLMIDAEGYQRDLLYAGLNHPACKAELERYQNVFSTCWDKCRRILEDTASAMIQINPAYMRAPSFELQHFVQMVMTRSFQGPNTRRRWRRIANLLSYTVHQAKRFKA